MSHSSSQSRAYASRRPRFTGSTSDDPILSLRISSEQRDLSEAYDLLDRHLKRRIERLGVDGWCDPSASEHGQRENGFDGARRRNGMARVAFRRGVGDMTVLEHTAYGVDSLR